MVNRALLSNNSTAFMKDCYKDIHLGIYAHIKGKANLNGGDCCDDTVPHSKTIVLNV